jgi:hypothetical protein
MVLSLLLNVTRKTNLRALGDPEEMRKSKVDVDLVQALVDVLESL